MGYAEVRKWIQSFNNNCPDLNTGFPYPSIFHYSNDEWGVCLPLHNGRHLDELKELTVYQKLISDAQPHSPVGVYQPLTYLDSDGLLIETDVGRYEDFLGTQPNYSFKTELEDVVVYIKNFKDNSVYGVDFVTLLSLISTFAGKPRDSWWACFFLDLYEIWISETQHEADVINHNGFFTTSMQNEYLGVSFTDTVDGVLMFSIDNRSVIESHAPAVLLKLFNQRYYKQLKRRFKIKTNLRYYLGRYNKMID